MPSIYGIAEIAQAIGVTRQLVAQWRVRGKLPPPTEQLAAGPFWIAEDIEPWIEEQRAKREGTR